jgi:hypothetical protein
MIVLCCKRHPGSSPRRSIPFKCPGCEKVRFAYQVIFGPVGIKRTHNLNQQQTKAIFKIAYANPLKFAKGRR